MLHVAARGGISPDAVVALRQGGTPWSTVARRYALDAASFHVRLDGDAGPLERVYEQFAARPRAQWGSIQLADADLIALVNLRVFSEVLRTPPERVLAAYERSGSWVGAYRALSSR